MNETGVFNEISTKLGVLFFINLCLIFAIRYYVKKRYPQVWKEKLGDPTFINRSFNTDKLEMRFYWNGGYKELQDSFLNNCIFATKALAIACILSFIGLTIYFDSAYKPNINIQVIDKINVSPVLLSAFLIIFFINIILGLVIHRYIKKYHPRAWKEDLGEPTFMNSSIRTNKLERKFYWAGGYKKLNDFHLNRLIVSSNILEILYYILFIGFVICFFLTILHH